MVWPGTIYLEQPYTIQSSEPARNCSQKKNSGKKNYEKKKKKVLKKERST